MSPGRKQWHTQTDHALTELYVTQAVRDMYEYYRQYTWGRVQYHTSIVLNQQTAGEEAMETDLELQDSENLNTITAIMCGRHRRNL